MSVIVFILAGIDALGQEHLIVVPGVRAKECSSDSIGLYLTLFFNW